MPDLQSLTGPEWAGCFKQVKKMNLKFKVKWFFRDHPGVSHKSLEPIFFYKYGKFQLLFNLEFRS